MHPGYSRDGGLGVPEEYAAIEAAKEELLSKNLTNVEGGKLRIDIASMEKFKQRERDQHAAFKSKQTVGYRNTGRTNKRRRDGEDEEEINWNAKKPSGHRARNKNPEVTLCTALDGCLREARVVDKELNWFGQPVPRSVAEDYDTIVQRLVAPTIYYPFSVYLCVYVLCAPLLFSRCEVGISRSLWAAPVRRFMQAV